MAPRFDFDNLSLEIAVADLLEPRLLMSLGFAHRGGYERLWLGQAIHSRYQEQALANDPTYQREVRLSHQLHYRGWQVTVSGRADGLRQGRDGRPRVEEIKSVRSGGALSPLARELYVRQASVYAWMLSRQQGLDTVPVLVLIEIGSGAIETIELEVDLVALERDLLARIGALVGAAEERREQAEVRRHAAGRLEFPFAEIRPGQELILKAVSRALEQHDHLLVEAPTGLGKTVSALFPALAYCLAHNKRLFVLTSKTLQQDMAMDVLRRLNSEGSFSALRLRAKAKMCAHDEVLCHEEYCPYARDYFAKLLSSRLPERLLAELPTLEPEAIFAAAKAEVVCPFEVSLDLAKRVEVTVCDYNYAFEPYVALAEFGAEGDLSDVVLVIDEVHNLVDRGRAYYSPELSSLAARQAAQSFASGGEAIHGEIYTCLLNLARLIETAVDHALEDLASDEAAEATVGALPEEALWRLRPHLDALFVDYLEYRRLSRAFRAEDPFVDLYFRFLRFLDVMNLSDGSFSHLLERGEGDGFHLDRRIKILCRDPSRFLGAVLSRTHSTIGLSATLSPPEFHRDLLGLEAARTAVLELPNPFPAENRRIVIDPSVTTSYHERGANAGPLAERLAELAQAVPGNCLALFPSYSFLAEVAGRLPLLPKRVLVQQRSDTDREREEILNHLRSGLAGDLLLLAVAGGVFAEGVDYPGDMLRAVAIVGPCLPALTLERRLLQEYYEERFDRGFEFAFVVPGMTRVVQAAGRLIRSAHDTGVIALLDRRFLLRPYRDHLPEDWLPEEGLKALTGHPGRAAAEFFRGLSPNR